MVTEKKEHRDLFEDYVAQYMADREIESKLRIEFGYDKIFAYRKDNRNIELCSMLLNDMSPERAKEVLTILQQNGILARKEKE